MIFIAVADKHDVIALGNGACVNKSVLRNRITDLFVGGLFSERLSQMLVEQRAFVVRVGVVGQQRKCTYVDRFDTFVEIAIADSFIITASGEKNIAADDFFG